jgi:hypothetical protein
VFCDNNHVRQFGVTKGMGGSGVETLILFYFLLFFLEEESDASLPIPVPVLE